MAERRFQCLMCTRVVLTNENLIKHVLNRHQHESRFHVACMATGCRYKGTNWRNFRQHCRRQHGAISNSSLLDATGDCLQADAQMESDDEHIPVAASTEQGGRSISQRELHVRRMAQFLLGLETKYRLSRVAVQAVWEGPFGFQSYK